MYPCDHTHYRSFWYNLNIAVEEIDEIVNTMIPKVKALGLNPERAVCLKAFLANVRRNLHVVLCFSPVGDDFRARAKKFPALVNATGMFGSVLIYNCQTRSPCAQSLIGFKCVIRWPKLANQGQLAVICDSTRHFVIALSPCAALAQRSSIFGRRELPTKR